MLKAIPWRKLVQNLRKFGFEGPYSDGKHLFMKKGTFKLHIPSKHKGDVSAGLLSEVLRQAGIDKKEWNKI